MQYGNPLWYGVTLLSYIALPDDAEFYCGDAPNSNEHGCRWNAEGKLVLFGAQARSRHRVIGQMPAWLCVGVLCYLLLFWWFMGFLALKYSLRCDLDVLCEEDAAAVEHGDTGKELEVLRFRTAWSKSPREKTRNDDSGCSESWRQQRST